MQNFFDNEFEIIINTCVPLTLCEVSVRSFAQIVMENVTVLNSNSDFAFWLRLSHSSSFRRQWQSIFAHHVRQ